MLEVADIVRLHGAAYRKQYGNTLTPARTRALRDIAACRTAVLNQDFSANTPAQPAARGSIVMAFLTGVGPVSPAVESGAAAPVDPLGFAALPASATIGGVEARVVAAAMVPGYVGLAQANIEIPASLQAGGHELRVQVGTEMSNGAVVSVE
jgi:uncharacterized protein (TIGR03437 family)